MIDLDLAKIVGDPNRTIREGAILPWTTPKYLTWNQTLIDSAPSLGVPLDVPFASLSPEQVAAIVEGRGPFPGPGGSSGPWNASRTRCMFGFI